ncbi:hypothetical protein RI367_006327 [Sorochytrium milnesiophthora]
MAVQPQNPAVALMSQIVPFVAPLGPIVSTLDMLMRMHTSFSEMDPSLKRLEVRLMDLSFLMKSIYELKPKHLALNEQFTKAAQELTHTIDSQFREFLENYEKKWKVTRFVLAPRDELIIRRMDEAITKTVNGITLILQVEGLYNINSTQDVLKRVLDRLHEQKDANAQLKSMLEARLKESFDRIDSAQTRATRKVSEIQALATSTDSTIKAVYEHLLALPPFLRTVENDDVRQLWQDRKWEDSVALERFLKGMQDHISTHNPDLRPLLNGIVSTANKWLRKQLSQDVGWFVGPQDLQVVPAHTTLANWFLAMTMGWMVLVDRDMQTLRDSAANVQLNCYRLHRLVQSVRDVVEPFYNQTAPLAAYKQNVAELCDFGGQDVKVDWPAQCVQLTEATKRIAGYVSAYNMIDLFSPSLDDLPILRDQDQLQEMHAQLYTVASELAALFPGLQITVPPADSLPEDVQSDLVFNDTTIAKYANIRASVAAVLTGHAGPWNNPYINKEATDIPSAAITSYFVRSESLQDVASLAFTETVNAPKLTAMLDSAVPVMIHPLPASINEPLPQVLVNYLARVCHQRPVHPSILKIIGVTETVHPRAMMPDANGHTGEALGNVWAVVTELPSQPMCSLGTFIADQEQFSYMSLCLRLQIALEAVAAIRSLHAHNLTHGSLCNEGILVDRKLNVKVIDGFVHMSWFGDATRDETVALLKILAIGTFASPSVLPYMTNDDTQHPLATTEDDIWSVGCMLYSVLMGKNFLAHCETKGILETAVSHLDPADERMLPVSSDLPPTLVSLFRACLAADPMQRPDITSVHQMLAQALHDAEQQMALTNGMANTAVSPPSSSSYQDSNGKGAANGFFQYSVVATLSRGQADVQHPQRGVSRKNSNSSLPSYHSPSVAANSPMHKPSTLFSSPATPYINAGGPSLPSPQIHQQQPMRAADGPNNLAIALIKYNDGMGDVKDAVRFFDEALLQGQSEAATYLGDIYYMGAQQHGIRQDFQRAFEYYYQATQKGITQGYVGLGDCYMFDLGLQQGASDEMRLSHAKHNYDLAYRNSNSAPTARLLCGLADLEYYRQRPAHQVHNGAVALTHNARAYYQAALEADPNYYRAMMGTADVLLADNRQDEAKRMYLMVADNMNLRRVCLGLSRLAKLRGEVSEEERWRVQAQKFFDY